MSGHSLNSPVVLGCACWWLSLFWLGAGASGSFVPGAGWWGCVLFVSLSEDAVQRTGIFAGIPLFSSGTSGFLAPEAPSRRDNSLLNFVMGLMVGDRRFPGATILGARFSISSANHPVSVPPTGPEHSDASYEWWVLFTLTVLSSWIFLPVLRDGFFCVLGLRIVVQAVAARRQVQNFVMNSPSGLLWDFGSLCQRRCGVVSDALSRQPSSSSTSLRRLWLGVAAQACGTSLSDISAFPDVAASRITRRRATATSTLLTRRGASATSTPLTRRGASAFSSPL